MERERESFSPLGVKRLQRYTEDFDVSSGLLKFGLELQGCQNKDTELLGSKFCFIIICTLEHGTYQ